jgi:hypothetical protein
VELLSAAVVLRRFFRSHDPKAEQQAARICGASLFVLAAFVVLASTLSLAGKVESRPSPLGIALLLVAAAVAPWLAREKRRLSAATASAAMRAEAAEWAMMAISPCSPWLGSAPTPSGRSAGQTLLRP